MTVDEYVRLEVPGRVCLLGDKVDLMGLPVIAATVDATLRVTARRLAAPRVKLWSDNFASGLDYPLEQRGDVKDHPLKYWCGVVWILRDRIGGFEATVNSDIPIGKGMASSGAVTVALVRALDALFALRMSDMDVAGVAYRAEHDELGIPCGRMDQYAIAFGGVTHIATCDPPVVTPVVALATGECPGVALVVGDTREPRPLHKLLVSFRERIAAGDALVLECYARIAECVEQGRQALQRGDVRALGDAMRGQMVHERRLGCITPGLERLCGAAEAAGAYGAKLIGVGGGGCMVALCPPGAQQAVADAIAAVGGVPHIVNVVSYADDGSLVKK